MTDTPKSQSSTPSPKRKPLTAIVRDFLGRKGATETQAQRNLLQYYASRCKKAGWCNPGHNMITRDTGVGHFTIDKANAHFRTMGILSWKKGWGNRHTGNKGKSNLYQLHLDRMELLTFLSTATLVDLALPLSRVRTATLSSSTATSEVSTATLSSSTLQQVAPKVQAFEGSSIEEQARKGNPSPPRSSAQKPTDTANETSSELLGRANALAVKLTEIALKDRIIFNQKQISLIAENLKTYSEQEIAFAFTEFYGQQDNWSVKNVAKNFSEGMHLLLEAVRREFERQRRERDAAQRQAKQADKWYQEEIRRARERREQKARERGDFGENDEEDLYDPELDDPSPAQPVAA